MKHEQVLIDQIEAIKRIIIPQAIELKKEAHETGNKEEVGLQNLRLRAYDNLLARLEEQIKN